MIRKLTLPLLAVLGFAAAGCEEYEAPDIDNNAPDLTLSQPTVSVITDTIKVAGIATDDKYVNALGFRIVNLEEDNSIDYTSKVRWGNLTTPPVPSASYPFNFSVLVSSARLIAGNYRLEVEAGDVQGLKVIKTMDLTLTKAGIKNRDSAIVSVALDTTRLDIDNKSDNRKFIIVSTRKVLDAEGVITNSVSAAAVDFVFGVVNNDTLIMSPKLAKVNNLVPDSVLFTNEIEIKNTTLTQAMLDTIVTSRQIRREFNLGTYVGNSAASSNVVKPVVGKVYAIKLKNNIYVMVNIQSFKPSSWTYSVCFYHKKF